MKRIGELAKRTNISAESIRHYEKIGLLHKAQRSESGQRYYDETHLERLIAIKKFRQFEFSLQEIAQLFDYKTNADQYTKHEVKSFVEQHLRKLDELMANLQAVHQSLSSLAQQCDGSDTQANDCPILKSMSQK